MDDEPSEAKIPAYVWTCDRVPVVLLDVAEVLARECDDAYDEFSPEDLIGKDELAAAMRRFNELNSHFVNWKPNYTRVLVLGETARVKADQ
jgi:hypothetical protein